MHEIISPYNYNPKSIVHLKTIIDFDSTWASMTDVLVCSTIDLIMIKLNISIYPKHMFQMRNI